MKDNNKKNCNLCKTDGQNIYRIDALLWGESAQKIEAISQLGSEKITFPPKPDGQTYSQIDRRTDICFYKVALLLKIDFYMNICIVNFS